LDDNSMRTSDDCPKEDILVGWNAGSLKPREFEAVSDHLETCSTCQAIIEKLEDQSITISRQLAEITTADLDRARQSIEADMQTAKSISSLLAELSPQNAEPFVPSLQVPCELRQYEVEKLLGHGGMGEVYAARHKNLKRAVALKVIRSNRQDDPIAQSHFLREIETAGQLDHPNLVRAYDAWEQDGFLFLAQELLDGDSLGSLATEGKIHTAAEILNYLSEICSGVEQLHACGFVHRDIKPSNIMRLRDGTVKLIDYGLAVPTDIDDSGVASRAGTVGYMAPEQASGNGAFDQRSDIYSLGCVLKYLLRFLPIDQTDEQDSTLRSELAQLADDMTHTRPEDRPSTITAVRERLEVLSKRDEIATTKSGNTNFYLVGAWLLGLILVSALATYFYRANPVSLGPSHGSETDGGRASGSNSSINPEMDIQPRTPFKLKMVDVPAGEFVMGGVIGDEAVRAEELPSRTVVFSRPFRISACEITVGQFREFVEATGCKTEAERSGEGGWIVSRSSSFGKLDPSFIWSNPGYPVSDNLPVTMVSYDDAVAFCEWLSARDQKTYRLPTEAEWEYCCRAGTTEVHSFPIAKINEYVWSLDTAGKNVFPRPVGTRQANAWGIYDMVGNVREWCLDWYSETAYQVDAGRFPAGPETGEKRVVRGGSYSDRDRFFRSSHRGYWPPETVVGNQGFRVVEVP
jgi:formylglycine-generating enzyme required for sulfatase activity